jgi:3-oxoacyl-[acyl-carrier protein] reductase
VELQGKVALVTGGGTGLGRAISLALAREGMAVAVNYSRSEAEARETVAELQARGARALAVQADVSVAEAVRSMVARVVAEWGRLDVLVNNAGVTRYIPLDDLEAVRPEDFDQIFAVNVKGAFLCTQAAVSHLKTHGCGKIVNVASNSAFISRGSSLPYLVSKAALVKLTNVLATTLAPTVQVNAVCPGWLDTRWLSRYVPPEKQHEILQSAELPPVDLDEVVQAVLLFVQSDSTSGQALVQDRGESLS